MTVSAMTMIPTETNDVELFLKSDLTSQEWIERQADQNAMAMAGMDITDKFIFIGEKLSKIYNDGTFRRSEPGGPIWSWEDYCRLELPRIFKGSDIQVGGRDWADNRRILAEARRLLDLRPGGAPRSQLLPVGSEVAKALRSLLPRTRHGFGGTGGGQWRPLDEEGSIEGLQLVWATAVEAAEGSQPNEQQVRASLRVHQEELEAQGLKRAKPQALKDNPPPQRPAINATARPSANFDRVMREHEASAPAREQQAKIDAVREELSKADRERRAMIETEIQSYSSKISAVTNAVHDLGLYMQKVDRIHGTQLLDELRATDYRGFITVANDLERLKSIGDELVQVVKLAQTSNPPSGINMTTVNVEAE